MTQPNAILETLETILLQESGCPICHFGRQAGRKYLDGILYESVNDFGLRQQLSETLGFCGFHSREMLTFSGAKLGAAIIEQAMLKESLRQIKRLHSRRLPQFGRGKNRAHGVHLPDEQHCLVCVFEQAHQRMAIEELLKHWQESWAVLLQKKGGMCVQHLSQAILLAPGPVQKELKQLHENLWQTHLAHLDEFIRKQDYRFQDEVISSVEGEASRRTIAILTGEPKK